MSAGNFVGGGRFRRSQLHLEHVEQAELGYRRRQRSQRARERAAECGEGTSIDLQEQSGQGELPALTEAFAPENLRRILDESERTRGQAPGIDGIRWSDLTHTEKWELCRGASQAVLTGRYRPQPSRSVLLPKPDGGHRELKLPVVLDRLIETAVSEALTQHLDPLFLDGSCAYRPGRGVMHMLAGIKRAVEVEGRRVLAQTDVRKAFDNVRVDDVLDAVRRHVSDESWRQLITTILRRHDGERQTGLDQGASDSPPLLNLLLHHVHDVPMSDGQQEQAPAQTQEYNCEQVAITATRTAGAGGTQDVPLSPAPWHRYSDNLVYLCHTLTEGEETLLQCRDLLQLHGFDLKESATEVIDLNCGQPCILGFIIHFDGDTLRYSLGDGALDTLQEKLLLAHEDRDPRQLAKEIVRGWIHAHGPALGHHVDQFVERISRTISEAGFRLLISRGTLRTWMSHAWTRWQTVARDTDDTRVPVRNTANTASIIHEISATAPQSLSIRTHRPRPARPGNSPGQVGSHSCCTHLAHTRSGGSPRPASDAHFAPGSLISGSRSRDGPRCSGPVAHARPPPALPSVSRRPTADCSSCRR